MKRVFICSRYAGDVNLNIAVAKMLCQQAVIDGAAPFAPHLLYPQFLDDDDPGDRLIGIACGLSFMEQCDEVWVYDGGGISPGMEHEIKQAELLGKPVIYWNPPGICCRCRD